MQMGLYAEEIQLLLPENQPEPPVSRVSGRSALMVGAAVLLVAVPIGLSRVSSARRMAEAAPTTAPFRLRA